MFVGNKVNILEGKGLFFSCVTPYFDKYSIILKASQDGTYPLPEVKSLSKLHAHYVICST